MNKEDFVDKYWDAVGGTKKDAEQVVNTFVDVLTDILQSGETLFIGSLGKFEIKDVPARTMKYLKGDNVGQQYIRPAYKKIVFKPSKAFKDKVTKEVD